MAPVLSEQLKEQKMFIKDSEASDKLLQMAVDTVKDEEKLNSLSENIKGLGFTNSADVIADEIIKLATR